MGLALGRTTVRSLATVVRVGVTVGLLALGSAAGDDPLLLRNVTLIDVTAPTAAEAERAGVSVLLAGDRIAAVGPVEEVAAPPGATVVDGSGRFLIPGLFDMHVHLSDLGDGALTSLVVHGVTSARDLGGDLEALDAALARVAAGELVGPRVARTGYVLEATKALEGMLASYDEGDAYAAFLRRTRIGITTAAEARRALARVVDSGADVLKIRSSPSPEVYRLLVREARRADLRVAGHDPFVVTLEEAASLGLGSVEHLPVRLGYGLMEDEDRRRIHAALVAHGTHLTPTFHALRNAALDSRELERRLTEERSRARWGSLTEELVGKWEFELSLRGEWVDENPTASKWGFYLDLAEKAVRATHADGVPLLAGTDLGLALLYPGLSLHDELVAFVERIGLTPLEALRTATVNGASWLGWEELGSIRVGHLADLVLLDANPLEDVAHVGRIHAVVAGGRYLGPEERARLLADVGTERR